MIGVDDAAILTALVDRTICARPNSKSPLRMSKAAQNTLKRAVVAAVQLPKVSDLEFEASLNELRELAKTLGFEVVATFTQKRTSFDSTAYLGLG